MSKEKKGKTLSEELEESRLAFEAAGIPADPADHPVYQDGAHTIRPVNLDPNWRRSAEQEKKKAFIAAVREGDVARVSSLLERRLLNCICDDRDYSPLLCAIENNDESLVEFLLAAGPT